MLLAGGNVLNTDWIRGLSGRRRGTTLAALFLTVAALGAACTTTSPGPPPDPSRPVWVCGDSLAFHLHVVMPSRPFYCGGGATGFTEYAPYGKVVDYARAEVDSGPWQPEIMLVEAGVNGSSIATLQEQIDGAIELESEMAARGVTVRFVAEPAKGWAATVEPLNDWLLANRPDTIDCRQYAISFYDGVHLSTQSNAAFGACVNDALPAHLQSPPA